MPKLLGLCGGMNQPAPLCRVAVTVAGLLAGKMTPTAFFRVAASAALDDGPSWALAAVGVLADEPLVAAA